MQQHLSAGTVVVVVVAVFATSLVSGASIYPKFSHVFNDPKTYALLYNAASGPINETLRFTRPVRLTSVVVPSQIIDFANQGSYEELLRVRLFRTVLSRDPAQVKTTQVASGRFVGKASFGQELPVLLHADDGAGNATAEVPVMAVYGDSATGSQYIVNVDFGQGVGIYPWYATRRFSTSATVHASSDVAGYVIGLSYTLV